MGWILESWGVGFPFHGLQPYREGAPLCLRNRGAGLMVKGKVVPVLN
jgi:hypothetical protein